MAQKNLERNSMNIPYGDLASEVTRRRSTMCMREETITKKTSTAKDLFFDPNPDSQQFSLPSMVYPKLPPAPPPSPADNSTDS